jgi:hypothetical protein
LPQRLAEFRDDLGRAVGEPVEDAEQSETDVLAGRSSWWRVVSRETEQMVAFVEGEVKTLGDGPRSASRRDAVRAPARAGCSSRWTRNRWRRLSSRRSPAVLRRCPLGRPTSSGCSDSRRRRRNSASPARSNTSASSNIAVLSRSAAEARR